MRREKEPEVFGMEISRTRVDGDVYYSARGSGETDRTRSEIFESGKFKDELVVFFFFRVVDDVERIEVSTDSVKCDKASHFKRAIKR